MNLRDSPHFAWVIAAIAALANACVWLALNPTVSAVHAPQAVAGFSFTPFQRWDDPVAQRFPTNADIERDLSLIASRTRAIRTYSAAQFPALPALAAKHGVDVTLGVFLNGQPKNDEAETAAAIAALRTQPNVSRVIVGNETLLKGTQTMESLGARIDAIRRATNKPVSTAEPWHIWLATPALAQRVDFITIHLLPYWEGIHQFNAVGHALYQYEQVKLRFPNKRVVIGEIGWPSGGDRVRDAVASPENQAKFIREFLGNAKTAQIDYFLMEAFDQPWKRAEEGRAGAFWGMFGANRVAKYDMRGAVHSDPEWSFKAALSSMLGFAAVFFLITRAQHLRGVAQVAFGATIQLVVSGALYLVTLPLFSYMYLTDWIALAIFVPTLVVMIVIVLAHAFEFVELFWEGSLTRTFEPTPMANDAKQPFVSIHLACCNEPPEMVIATLKSLQALDYDAFEVLVIDNNTKDASLWKPVEAYVASLPANFRFMHLPSWPGFKAGALNVALKNTDARADVIAVVDADYEVKPHWLRSFASHFARPNVGIVQAPQAHREWSVSSWRAMMNWEYDGFFRIGMHHRNERNAIVQHGTMTMICADALRKHGGWDENCVCEDSELGLRLMSHGYATVYVDDIVGQGLTPDSFAGFKKQRKRWAEGAMQIMKKHAPVLLKPGRLSAAQRYHFLAGWLPWIGDALHLVFALAAVLWTAAALIAPGVFTLPTALFLLPLATFIVAKLIIGPVLYWRRVPCSWKGIVGASIAGMAVSHAVARGVFAGLSRARTVFEITDKGSTGAAKPSARMFGAVREELLLLALLLVTAVSFAMFGASQQRYWIVMLILQALPYAATVFCAWLSAQPEKSPDALREPRAANS
jgi:exo-beta-1,3-glucanase (GH17 family)/cellulose synthase/poly-beta-1,6-N-acetylglucosamine synthase-like glycosyltransferase